ncbi:MAG: tetratricopeptide repeat protein [Stellaceae bacterium]
MFSKIGALVLALIVVFSITIGVSQVANAGPDEDAMTDLAMGKTAEGLKILHSRAETGDVQAQIWLGEIYRDGQDVSKDYAKSVKWFGVAAKSGNALGQFEFGEMYFLGEGVTQNHVVALEYYRLAANQGFAKAQVQVGMSYMGDYGEGEAGFQDYNEAVRWFRLAAEQGDGDGQSLLGSMYEMGQGVPQDYVRAYMWDNLAASSLKGMNRDSAIEDRDAIAAKMTPAQLELGQKMAIQCEKANFKNCD